MSLSRDMERYTFEITIVLKDYDEAIRLVRKIEEVTGQRVRNKVRSRSKYQRQSIEIRKRNLQTILNDNWQTTGEVNKKYGAKYTRIGQKTLLRTLKEMSIEGHCEAKGSRGGILGNTTQWETR